MGYHVHQFVDLLCRGRRGDFWELLIHHLVAIVLFSMCYLLNLSIMGAIVAFVHYSSDIFCMALRGFSETKFRKVTIFSAVLMAISWFWTRLVVFPYLIWVILTKTENILGSVKIKYFMGFLLCVLLFLHYHWFITLVSMVARRSQQAPRIRQEVDRRDCPRNRCDEGDKGREEAF
jgi:ceramide synthetase